MKKQRYLMSGRFFVMLTMLFAWAVNTSAQTIGGNAVFNFLKLPNTPQLSSLGGINVSAITNDVGMSFNNPSLLRENMSGQFTAVFNSLYAGIHNYHLMGAYHSSELSTTFSGGVHYLDYGSLAQTDAAGNELGIFRPGDYVVQVSASRKYLENFNYGVSLKFINSNYGLYRSNGIALDAGIAYYDSSKLFQASLVLKNMGAQLKKYVGSAGDGLPFDLELGITKRLANAPVQFSITGHHLHQYNIRYNDTSFNNDNGFTNPSGKGFSIDNVFRHIIIGCQFYAGDKIEISAAYNHLRRSELSVQSATNGLNGFSLGVGALFKKLQIRYARTYYQSNTAYNQFGINVNMKEFVL